MRVIALLAMCPVVFRVGVNVQAIRAATINRSIDIIAVIRHFQLYGDIFCRCDAGDILSVHQLRRSKFQSESVSVVLALFVVVGVMSESCEEV